MVAINIYPKLAARALGLLRCSPSPEAVQNAIQQWRAEDLENAGAEAGVLMAMVRTFEEFRKEPQYTEVLSTMPLITVEKIGESEPVPFKKDGKSPLDGIRAFGMGHVIAGAGIGRDLADTGPMSSTSGGPATPKSRRLPGTRRSGCVRRSWITPKRIAPSSIAC